MAARCLELHPPAEYVLRWRRIGADASFTHAVMACSQKEAILLSTTDVQLGLGPNYPLWRLEEASRASVRLAVPVR